MAQEAHRFTAADGTCLDYLLFLPALYGEEPQRRWPLILFLHGAGEQGADLALVKKHGIARLVDEQAETFPFLAISPQCPAEHRWTEYTDLLLAIVEQVSSAYAVDRRRVYLTGLSMGGLGTWVLGAAAPERFAALAPICGPLRPPTEDWEARARALAYAGVGLPRRDGPGGARGRFRADGRGHPAGRRRRPPDRVSGGGPRLLDGDLRQPGAIRLVPAAAPPGAAARLCSVDHALRAAGIGAEAGAPRSRTAAKEIGKMKFGVFTVSMPDYEPLEALEVLANLGYDGVEWRVTPDPERQVAPDLLVRQPVQHDR